MTLLYLKTIKVTFNITTMTTELKNRINTLITDLEEYRDGNDNITDFHIIASMNEIKNDICDYILDNTEQHTFYITK